MDLAETRSVKEQLGTAKVLCTAAKSRRTPVALKLEDKQAIVAEVTEAAGSALSAVLADYRGLNVGQMTELRKKAREANVYVRVIRNTLARRAVAGTEFACLEETFTGPTLLALSLEDGRRTGRGSTPTMHSRSRRLPSVVNAWVPNVSTQLLACPRAIRRWPCSWGPCLHRSPSLPRPSTPCRPSWCARSMRFGSRKQNRRPEALRPSGFSD